MSLKGHILDSNGLINLELCVATEKYLISVKNSKNSLIFAPILAVLAYLKLKKMTFMLSEKARKGQFSASHPYCLQQ